MQPRKILILVWPETSAYNATFRLARVLCQRGHEVVYAVPARWQEYVSRQGFRAVSLDIPLGPSRASTDCWRSIAARRDLADQQIQDLCESLAWLRSDGFGLVLLYGTLWQYALVMRRFRIPCLLVNPCLASVWSLEIPPIFSRLVPLSGNRLLNRLQCATAWFMLRFFGAFNHRYRGIIQPQRLDMHARLRDIDAATRHLFRSLLEPLCMPVYYRLLHVAQREGVRIGWGDYGHRVMWTELVLGAQAIDFPRSTYRHRRIYVGACVDTGRIESSFDWSRMSELKPIVFCAVGSHGGYWNAENHLRLVESVIVSFRERPEYQLLLQTPRKDECTRFGPLPDNILIAPWYPQLEVLARAFLVISHGGFGTVREALFYGVPMILFPFGVDQSGNAARVARAEVGLAGDIRRVTPALIGSMLERVQRPPYRENAARLSRALQAANTCGEAITLIERVLSGG